MATHQTFAPRATELQTVREGMAEAMLAYTRKHANKIAHQVDIVHEANHDLPSGSRSLPPLPPMGVVATPGLGKSHAVTKIAEEAADQGLPVLILVPNHELAEEYSNRLAHLNPTVYQGRREPRQAKPNQGPVDPGPHACYKLIQVSAAGEQNHRPAQGLCRQCPHGHAGVLKYVRDEVRREKATQFFTKNGIDPDTVPPCQFLFRGLPEQLAAPILISPVQAFSEAMAVWHENDPITRKPIRQIQRLIIVDEHIKVSQEVEISAGDITVWRNRLDALQEKIEHQISVLQNKIDPTEEEKGQLRQAQTLLDMIPEIDEIFRDLAAKIAGDQDLTEQDKQRLIALQKEASRAGASIAGTAMWEKVAYLRDDDDFFIPLRALSTLAKNCKVGAIRQEKGTLYAYEISPVIEWAKSKGSILFLDATMGQDMRRFIESLGGQIHEATASQNMRVTRVVGRLYSRGDPRKDDYPQKARERMQEIRDLIAPKIPRPAAIITHKAYLKYSVDAYQAENAAEIAAWDFEEATGVPIGWFGKHDRGQNNWGGRHLALVGMPLLSKESISGAYACTRAAMLACGLPPAEWPEWDQVMDKQKADADGPPMPVMPQVRAWLIDHYAQTMAQAAGRNRAVNHPSDQAPLQVALWGGLQSDEMDTALQRYGIVIHESVRNPNSMPGPKVDDTAVDEAIDMLRAVGGKVSERNVRAALIGLRRSASAKSIRDRLRELRAAGVIPPAERVRKEQAEPQEPIAAQAVERDDAVDTEVSAPDCAEKPKPQTETSAIAPKAVQRPKDCDGGQGKGQESAAASKSPDAPKASKKAAEATASNSYIDSYIYGVSTQLQDKAVDAGINTQATQACCLSFAPDPTPGKSIDLSIDLSQSASDSALSEDSPSLPSDDEIAEMLQAVAAEIEAELGLGSDLGDGPDDPAPQGPGGGPGGSRSPRERPDQQPSTIAHIAHAAPAHIPHENPVGAAASPRFAGRA